MVKRVLDFVSTGQDTTGKTPSFQATLKGDTQKIRYQIKRSNYINRLRRWVGLDPDQSDILGEYIASRVTASLLNKNPPPDLAPEVDLVYNEEHNDFSLASKYLNDRDQRFHGMTLGELIEDKDALQVQEIKNTTDKYFNESRALLIGILNKMRPIKSSSPKEKNLYKEAENSIRNLDVIFHKIEENRNTQIEVPYEKRRKKTKLVFGKASNNQLSIDKPFKTQIDGQTETISINKPELYNALASSIILGDHDINPNNFYAIFDKTTKEMHIGRIDLGHAFNDLIKNWMVGVHTPNIANNQGAVLDFLNRQKENGGITKFNRHIDKKVVLDPQFAQALRDQSDNVTNTLDTCKKELLELMEEDDKVRDKLVQSAKTLQKRIGVTGFFDKASHFIGNIQNKTLRNIVGGLTLLVRKVFQVALFLPKIILSIPKKIVMLIPPIKNYFKQKQHKSDEKLIDSLFENCKKYITNNQQESKSVANLIDIQVTIKNLLEKENPTQRDIEQAKNKIEDIYRNDQHYLKNKSFKDKIEWVSHSDSNKPLKMNLNKYIKTHAKELGKKDLAKQIVKTFKKKTTVSQVHVEERRSMATHKEVNHNISLNYKKRIEHHPLKKTHHPIENHGHIKRKCWVSEIHDNRNVGRISH